MSELYHHGVDGMRWGKRNGPPYPLDAQGKAALRAQKKGHSHRQSLQKIAESKSSEELKKEIDRIKLENDYKKLKRSDIERGSDFVKGLGIAAAATFATTLAVVGGKKGAEGAVATFLKKVLDPQVFKAIYGKK